MSVETVFKVLDYWTRFMVFAYLVMIAWGVRLRLSRQRHDQRFRCRACKDDGQVCNECEKPGDECKCPDSSLPTPKPCPKCKEPNDGR
jgi:hypothetical protein